MSSKLFYLIVSIPGQDPATHELSSGFVSLGRGPDNDIQVLVSEVSVKHAEISIDGDTVKIADVGSTNGTKLKGQAVGEGGVELSEKSKVLLGETIPAYFVSAADLEGASAEELIKSIEAADESAKPKTEPVTPVAKAVPASPAAPAVPALAGGAAPAAKPVAPVPLKRPGAAAAPKPVPVPKPPPKP